MIDKETGSRSYVVLYYNKWNELRPMMVEANSRDEVIDIAEARGMFFVAIENCGTLIHREELRRDGKRAR